MSIRNRDFEDLLQTKFGFVRTQKEQGHRWYTLKLDGLPVIATRASHGKEEIAGNLENIIAKQMRVRVPFWRGMMQCTNSRENYYKQVRTDPFPPWDIRF